MKSDRRAVIFLGNGPLAEAAAEVLAREFEIVFWARRREDLEKVARLKRERPEVPAVLASFGVMIPGELLDLFEETGGILNIHPSLLPRYRGASPIESAILAGEQKFGVSVMKLVKAMDAGPIYYQTGVDGTGMEKAELYDALARAGAEWIVKNLFNLPEPVLQDDAGATYCEKLTRAMSPLDARKPAEVLAREVRALAGWPKSTYEFFGKECIVHRAHVAETAESALDIECGDGKYLVIDELQPAGKKRMDAKAFLNGYAR